MKKIKVDALKPVWSTEVIKVICYAAYVCVVADSICDCHLLDMMTLGKGNFIGFLVKLLPDAVWGTLAVITQVAMLVAIYKSMSHTVSEYFEKKWLILIALTTVCGLLAVVIDDIFSGPPFVEILGVILSIALVVVWFMLGSDISRRYSGKLGAAGRVFSIVPAACLVIMIVLLFLMPDDFGHLEEKSYEYGRYVRIEQTFSTRDIIYAIVIAICESLSGIIPLATGLSLINAGPVDESSEASEAFPNESETTINEIESNGRDHHPNLKKVLAGIGIAIVLLCIFLLLKGGCKNKATDDGDELNNGEMELLTLSDEYDLDEEEVEYTEEMRVVPVKAMHGAFGLDRITCGTQGGNVYKAENLFDNNSSTAWVIGDAEYQQFSKETEGHYPPMIGLRPNSRVQVAEIWLLNGYQKNEKSWKNNARVREITVMGCYDDSQPADELFSGNISDSQEWQRITLHDKGSRYDYYTLIINEIYPGKKWNDIAISEIQFFSK